ncbi:BTB domain-containing protein [Mycena kentingensis (nom. inval.)]|nr:BTB domain-containing protein [Mycena kentingensis (nom. inval.)]
MSTDARPAKRPRADEPAPENPITRTPDYWFEDGSIVLQVESTQFRVAKTLLAKHSSVFRDMLSLPSTEDSLVEGCPVVVLPGDSTADWNHMYPATYYDAEKPSIEQLS